MKKLLLILLLIPSLAFSQVARDFIYPSSAIEKPTPTASDISLTLSNALALACNNGKELVIPAGTWKVDSILNSGDILIPPSNMTTVGRSLHIHGEDGAILTCSKKSTDLFNFLNSLYSRIEIDGIDFVNTHDTTNLGPTCLLFQGIKPYWIHNLYIHDCTFQGWLHAITLKGVHGAWIYRNKFTHLRGHDDGTTTESNPNVDIALVDDSLGDRNRDIFVYQNEGFGCSPDSNITTLKTKGPADGFIYGDAAGLDIYENHLYYYSQEAILVQPQLAVVDSGVTSIHDNFIDAGIPVGSADTSGTLERVNYAIRAEAQHLRIYNNTITHATNGIFCDATNWNFTFTDWQIFDNNISFAKDTTKRPSNGIYIQGHSSSVRLKRPIVKGNLMRGDSVSLRNDLQLVACNNCDSASITGNQWSAAAVTENGNTIYGVSLNTGTNVNVGTNPGFETTDVQLRLSSATANQTTILQSNYTPSITGTSNNASVTPALCYYTQVNNTVYVWGVFTAAATTGNTLMAVEITLPISSAITIAATDLSGSVQDQSNLNTGPIAPDGSTHKAVVNVKPPSTSSITYSFFFNYVLK